MDHFYKNVLLLFLFRSPDLLSRLQNLKLVESEEVVSFQWLGPHFLAFLEYATKLSYSFYPVNFRPSLRYDIFKDLLKRLDDSASDCILYGETEHYDNFLEIVLSFMPKIREFFTYQHEFTRNARQTADLGARFINFLLKTIGELLSYGTDSSVLLSNQVKILLKELKFLLTFLLDTLRCIRKEKSDVFLGIEEDALIDNIFEGNIFTEIEVVSNEVGLFLHSFFFTTDRVTATNMDLAINVLLERIEIVKVKIKDYCIAVSKKLNCRIGSLEVAETPSEVSSSQDKSIPMKGFKDMATQIKNRLLRGTNNRQIISIVGMPGLGKTTLAKKLYNDSEVRSRYDVISWCVVSQTYKKRKLLIDILRSAGNLAKMKDQDQLALCLYQSLRGRRYLIVLDDLWDEEAWDNLEKLFPEDTNGSRVLFTSRQKNVASRISQADDVFEPPRLSQAESWDLLEKQVFKKERCPQELQNIGKEIAEQCDGLPLSVVTIAGVLSNMEMNESLWHQVALSLSSYVSQKANDYIPNLKLSYMHLPDHLKPCFLYLSAFQEDEEISVRKLLLLWIAEGLVEEKEHKSLEGVAEEYLIELIDRSLLQVAKRRADNGVKACTLHDLVLEMCWKIAEEEKFLFQHQFLISKHRHRLCMDQSRDPSEVLSILLNPEKIRISDAEHDYDVQMGIKIMPDLRYLKIPSLVSSVVKLQKLESLTVERKTKIPAYLLNLPKLRHLCVGDLYSPGEFDKDCDSSLINYLQTLCYVIMEVPAHEKILRCSPNLRELSYTSRLSFIPDLNFLSRLESLTMVFQTKFRGDYSVVKIPENIKNLSLHGMLLPWEMMSLIGTMPNLEILKLYYGACEGEIWNTNDDEFQKLKFLKLRASNLEQWNSSKDHFPILEQLVLRLCNKLEMIPSDFSNIPTLQKIEIYNCGEDVISSALQILDEQRDNGNEEFQVIY